MEKLSSYADTDAQGKFVMPMLPLGVHVYLKHNDPRWAQFRGRYNIIVEPLAKIDGTEPTLQLAEPGAIRGDENSSACRDYDVRGIPTYVVIDAFGKIASKGHDFEEAAKVALELVGKK